jgi:hypothetical protein
LKRSTQKTQKKMMVWDITKMESSAPSRMLRSPYFDTPKYRPFYANAGTLQKLPLKLKGENSL